MPARSSFPTTRWTLILASRAGDAPGRVALEQLLATYWKPIYVFMRRKGLDVDSAQDAVQDLFVQLLERGFLDRLEPSRGRFRSYLRKAADHFLIDRHDRQSAQKRGGGAPLVSLDVEGAERDLAVAPTPPELAYEREWAVGVMERSLARLRLEYEDGTRRGNVDTLFRFFGFGEVPSYDEAAAHCAMTAPQFKAALHRARARLREILREEVADTVDSVDDGDRELSDLLRILSS
jgi:RNA polymerase sigma factor (sigma-70 family)